MTPRRFQKGISVLIIGEYSGFSRNLKAGFKKSGCEVTVYTSGDSFKKLEYDENDLYVRTGDIRIWSLRLRGSRRIVDFLTYFNLERFKRKNKAAIDFILILNPDFLSSGHCLRGHFTINDCRRLLKSNGRLFLSACGVDIPYLRFGDKMRYWPFSGNTSGETEEALLKLDNNLFKLIIEFVDAVIPVVYDFAFPYRELNKTMPVNIEKVIPLPIDVESIRYVPGRVNGKIVVFHGRSRDDFKGSDLILAAMRAIKEKYPDRIELMLPVKLPLNEYLEEMSLADIIVDQCRSYSYAMNALYAMAMGKVVLSGNEPECISELGFTAPVINILPEVSDIVSKLESLVNDPAQIEILGKAGRDCVMMFHDSGIIASKYLSLLTDDENKE